ncbi:MAG: hypothetical protein H6713_22125 [Myxococcales bacterium]|nr:hypothetical protein [Myxococcales bacterium]MCB9752661.1 hypothetical protein [Myxococcales bacterium]
MAGNNGNNWLTGLIALGGATLGAFAVGGLVGSYKEKRAFIDSLDPGVGLAFRKARIQGLAEQPLDTEIKYDRRLGQYYVHVPLAYGAYCLRQPIKDSSVVVSYSPSGDRVRSTKEAEGWCQAFLSVYEDLVSLRPYLYMLDWTCTNGVSEARVAGAVARIRPTPWGDVHHLFFVNPSANYGRFDYLGEGDVEELMIRAAVAGSGVGVVSTPVRNAETTEGESRWIYCEDDPLVVARAKLAGRDGHLELAYGERGFWEVQYCGASGLKLLGQGELDELVPRRFSLPDSDRVTVWNAPTAVEAVTPRYDSVQQEIHIRNAIDAQVRRDIATMKLVAQERYLQIRREAAAYHAQLDASVKERVNEAVKNVFQAEAWAQAEARAEAQAQAQVEARAQAQAQAQVRTQTRPAPPSPTPAEQGLAHVRNLRPKIPSKINRGVLVATRWIINALDRSIRSGRITGDLVGSRGRIVDQLAELSGLSPCSKDRNVLRPTFQWAERESALFEQNNPKLWTVKLGQLDTLFG